MISFDAEGLVQALIQRLILVMDSLMNEFYREAIKGLSPEGQEDTEVEKAKYVAVENCITSKCIFYTQAILDSFGTGSLADTSAESYWEEYTQSPSFNEARKTSGHPEIVGRKTGTYVDVWGHTRGSSGTQAGKNLEGLNLKDYNTGEYRQVVPTPPSHSIQNAEAWMIRDTETKIERRIEMEIEKFLIEEGSNYFVEVGE